MPSRVLPRYYKVFLHAAVYYYPNAQLKVRVQEAMQNHAPKSLLPSLMSIIEIFKIRAAFVMNKYDRYHRQSAGHGFLQLIKEFPGRTNPKPVVMETFYAFPVSEEVQASCALQSESLLFPLPKSQFSREWRIYCFKGEMESSPTFLPKPDATHVIFEGMPSNSTSGTSTLEDCNALVTSRWGMAKQRCKDGEKLTLQNAYTESVVLDDNVRNEVYEWLSLMMNFKPHKFEARALSSNKPTPPIPKNSLGADAKFWIKAAVINRGELHSSHYFWILTKFVHSNEVDVDSIRGFTISFETDTYGNISPRTVDRINTKKSKLKVCAVPHPRYPAPNAAKATLQWEVPGKTEIIYGNRPQQADGLARWSRAKWFLGELNKEETPSSSFSLFHQSGKSYLAFATVAVLLGISLHNFNGYRSFRTKSLILPKREISKWIDSYSQVEPRARTEER